MVQLIFEITWACPARCPFCTVPKSSKQLPLKDYRRILELFKERFGSEENAVVLSGGEPSSVPELKDYVDIAKRLGYMVTVVTNAFYIKNVLEARPDIIELSIDYFGEKHDKTRGVPKLFENAVKLVEMASFLGIQVVVRSTAMKDNIDDIIKLRQHLGGNVPIIVMPVRGNPQLKPSEEQLKKLMLYDGIYVSDNCPAGISSFVITPDKEVLVCIFYRKKLGEFSKFTIEELDQILEEGSKIPRFPCEKPSGA